MKFNSFIRLIEGLRKEGAIFVDENFDWVNSINIPKITLDLPGVEKNSKIVILNKRINPIYMQLEDGSKLFFTYDEFRRIQGVPKVGRKVNLQLQRLSSDASNSPSKIIMCRVH